MNAMNQSSGEMLCAFEARTLPKRSSPAHCLECGTGAYCSIHIYFVRGTNGNTNTKYVLKNAFIEIHTVAVQFLILFEESFLLFFFHFHFFL